MKRNQINASNEAKPKAQHVGKSCLLLLVGVLIWPGCAQQRGSSALSEPAAVGTAEINPAGTYSLVSLDGKAVPCTVQHESRTMNISSGKFIITADGNCSSTMSIAGLEAPIEVRATYRIEGPKMTMHWQGGGMTIGTIADNTLTMNNEGMTFVYRK